MVEDEDVQVYCEREGQSVQVRGDLRVKLKYDYDQDPRYGWYTLKVEEGDNR